MSNGIATEQEPKNKAITTEQTWTAVLAARHPQAGGAANGHDTHLRAEAA